MPVEIEKKFLVKETQFLASLEGTRYQQGYLTDSDVTVRIRIAGGKGFLTIKGPSTGISRSEFEYPIPLEDAEEIINTLCSKPIISKLRYQVYHGGKQWEVDVFEGENAGLIVAEIELNDELETVDLPPWLGEEVSMDMRYYNSNLAHHPYSKWPK